MQGDMTRAAQAMINYCSACPPSLVRQIVP
jgi:hypothetical protein